MHYQFGCNVFRWSWTIHSMNLLLHTNYRCTKTLLSANCVWTVMSTIVWSSSNRAQYWHKYMQNKTIHVKQSNTCKTKQYMQNKHTIAICIVVPLYRILYIYIQSLVLHYTVGRDTSVIMAADSIPSQYKRDPNVDSVWPHTGRVRTRLGCLCMWNNWCNVMLGVLVCSMHTERLKGRGYL
jgi:hypothetical protein